MSKTREGHREVQIAGRRFQLDRAGIVRAAEHALPEPLNEHFVVVEGRRYPPKQVISLATGLDRADFTTHQARRILKRLGFTAARRSGGLGEAEIAAEGAAPDRVDGAQALEPYIGQWVAMRDDEVLVGAESVQVVVGWLTSHGQKADALFRVPESEAAAGGLAPL